MRYSRVLALESTFGDGIRHVTFSTRARLPSRFSRYGTNISRSLSPHATRFAYACTVLHSRQTVDRTHSRLPDFLVFVLLTRYSRAHQHSLHIAFSFHSSAAPLRTWVRLSRDTCFLLLRYQFLFHFLGISITINCLSISVSLRYFAVCILAFSVVSG